MEVTATRRPISAIDDMKEVSRAGASHPGWALDEQDRARLRPSRCGRMLTCEAETGACGACCGLSLASGEPSEVPATPSASGRPVDRRARHPADDAHVPYGRRPASTSPGPAPRGRAVRGPHAEAGGRRLAHRGARHQPHQDHRRARLRAAPAGSTSRCARSRAGSVIFFQGERVTRQLHEWLTRGTQHMRIVEPVSLEGQIVSEGQPVLPGVLAPTDLMASGVARATRYLVEQVQQVYRAQGVEINDKHIEVIARQMTRRVLLDHPGSTSGSRASSSRSPRSSTARERAGRSADGRAAHRRSPDPRHHQGQPRDRELPVRRVVPGDHQVLTDAAIEGKIDA